MTSTHQRLVRAVAAYLAKHPTGRTVAQLAGGLGLEPGAIRQVLADGRFRRSGWKAPYLWTVKEE